MIGHTEGPPRPQTINSSGQWPLWAYTLNIQYTTNTQCLCTWAWLLPNRWSNQPRAIGPLLQYSQTIMQIYTSMGCYRHHLRWVTLPAGSYSFFYSTMYAQRQDVNTLQIEYNIIILCTLTSLDTIHFFHVHSYHVQLCISLYCASSIMHYQVLTVNEVNGFLLPLPPLPPPKMVPHQHHYSQLYNCIIGNDIYLWHKKYSIKYIIFVDLSHRWI